MLACERLLMRTWHAFRLVNWYKPVYQVIELHNYYSSYIITIRVSDNRILDSAKTLLGGGSLSPIACATSGAAVVRDVAPGKTASLTQPWQLSDTLRLTSRGIYSCKSGFPTNLLMHLLHHSANCC